MSAISEDDISWNHAPMRSVGVRRRIKYRYDASLYYLPIARRE